MALQTRETWDALLPTETPTAGPRHHDIIAVQLAACAATT